MKKIILGTILTTMSPFISIIGYYLLSNFKVSEGAMMFASVMGSLSIILNFIIGCLLIIKGYQDERTFAGWGA